MKASWKANAVTLMFLISMLAVLVISIYSRIIVSQSLQMLENTVQQRLLLLSKSAAQLATSDELDQFQTTDDMKKPAYAQLRQDLLLFTEDAGILFTYYLRPVQNQPGMLQFIIDSDSNVDEQVGLHTEPVAMEPAPEDAMLGKAACSGIGNYSQNWDGILSAFAPVYDAQGNVYCIVGVDMSDEMVVNAKRNITALNHMMLTTLILMLASGYMGIRLYRNRAQLFESASISKSQFLSRMSHEIRTPMNAIIGLCRMAKSSDDISEIKHYLDTIGSSSGHLLHLVNDVLDISKIESGKIVLEEVLIDVRAEADGYYSIIASQTQEKAQRFTLDISPDVPQYFHGDSTHIKQIVVNLLSNAVKFTPVGGKISLTIHLLETRGMQACLGFAVRDNGIGIEVQHIKGIFDPFEQGDGSTTRKFGGTGLGLSISKQLAERMGGTLNVKSKPGEGSEFLLNIWVRTALESEIRGMQELTTEPGQKFDMSGKHVLLVEDAEINRMIAQHLFEAMGAEVSSAENGAVCLEKYTQTPQAFDIIFMDISMPVMDGYEATRRIRQSGMPGAGQIPIIAMTANVFREDVERALAAGMNAHVGKPFEVEQVEAAIIQAMM